MDDLLRPVELLLLATPRYLEPGAREWHPDLRHTVGHLRRAGHSVAFASIPVDSASGNLRLPTPHPTNVSAVYVDLTEENFEAVLQLLPLARASWPEALLLVGGLAATVAPGRWLEACPELDFAVVGEREGPLRMLLERLRAGTSLDEVPGLFGRAFQNGPARPMADLDALGPMALDGVEALLQDVPAEQRVGTLMTARGCYARCSFCGVAAATRRQGGPAWRGRGVVAVVDELETLQARFGLSRFAFQDDCFFGPGRAGQERARAFAREVLRRRLEVRFFACCLIRDLDEETLQLLMAAGLSQIGVGVESLDPASLELFGKGIDVEEIETALARVERLQLPCEVNLIFFQPTMDLAGVRRNLEFLKSLREKRFVFYSDGFPLNALEAFPWSPVTPHLREAGLLDGAGRLVYRDWRVGLLATFAERLRRYVPATFKRRTPLLGMPLLEAHAGEGSGAETARAVVGRALRQWVVQQLLPEALERALAAVEALPVTSGPPRAGVPGSDGTVDAPVAGALATEEQRFAAQVDDLVRRLEAATAEAMGAVVGEGSVPGSTELGRAEGAGASP